jgi:hypothetical protein
MGVLESLDEDGNGTISKKEFNTLLEIPQAVNALTELGVDVPNLVSLSDHLFEVDEVEDKGKGGHNRQKGMKKPPRPAGASLEDDEEEEEEDEEEVCLTFGDFLEMVIRLRSSNPPSVLDVVDLRKLILRSQRTVMKRLDAIEDLNIRLTMEVQMIGQSIECLASKDAMVALENCCDQPLLPDGEVDFDVDFDMWDIAEETDAYEAIVDPVALSISASNTKEDWRDSSLKGLQQQHTESTDLSTVAPGIADAVDFSETSMADRPRFNRSYGSEDVVGCRE